MRQITLAALFLTLAPVLSNLAHAQTAQCAPLEMMLAKLNIQFGERPLIVGATPSGGKMMILTNPDTGTWTVLAIQAPATACVGMSGDGLVTAKPSKPGAPI